MSPDQVLPSGSPVSGHVAQRILEVHGQAGQAWLRGLAPALTAFTNQHGLERGQTVDAGYSYVEFVTDARGTLLVLKAAPPTQEFKREIEALAAFAGRGAPRVHLADAGKGVLVMDRVVPGRALVDLDDQAATEVAAGVMQKLRTPPPPGPARFTPVERLAEGFARLRRAHSGGCGPLPPRLVAAAEDTFLTLLQSAAPKVVLHGDLHHWNILEGPGGTWLVIDPKGYLGEPAYEPGALLRNPVDRVRNWADLESVQHQRLETLAGALGLDARRVRAWAFAQAVLSACWSLEDHGAGWETSIACAESLAPARGGF